MKMIYEEPTMETVIFDEMDIVTISGEEVEPSGGSSGGSSSGGGSTSEDFDSIFKF